MRSDGGDSASASAWLQFTVGLFFIVLFLGLWLDAALYRIFTIELGPDGVGSLILSVLFEELSELAMARKFFRAHLAFSLLLPLAIVTLPVLLLLLAPPSVGEKAWLALFLFPAIFARDSLVGSFVLPRRSQKRPDLRQR